MKTVNNLPRIISNLKKCFEPLGDIIGANEVASMQAITPVLTGALRRSETYEVEATDDKLNIIIGTDQSINYAAKVEFENRSYLRKTLINDANKIVEQFAEGIKENVEKI